MFRVEMLPAGHGDSLLIAYGDPAAPRYVLIDGGPYYTYRNQRFLKRHALSHRLEDLARQGARLELLVTTHVDADHIEGVVKLLGNWPPGLEIGDLWFNAWPHLVEAPDELLGAEHGEMLSGLIGLKRLNWNAALDGKRVAAPEVGDLAPIPLADGLQLTLLSPRPAELAALAEAWEEELRLAGLDPNSPERALERLKESARLRPGDLLGAPAPDPQALDEEPCEGDDSPANGSSIAFLAEFEGKRCLFAGDAHPDVLEASLRRLARQWGEPRVRLDAFKVAHHGSGHNLSRELLERVDCPRYLISSNGSYFGHPDPAAMARIILHGGAEPQLCFNYRSEENEVWDNDRLRRDYGYRTQYPAGIIPGLAVEL